MKPPKIRSVIIWQNGTQSKRADYISIDAIKEWMYCNYGAEDFMVKLETFLNSEE